MELGIRNNIMTQLNHSMFKKWYIAIVLAICCITSFLIRCIPFFNGVTFTNLPDSLYTIRLMELIEYNGYLPLIDYFTAFPAGNHVVWGSVFTHICILLKPLLFFVPPLLFCGVIILVYFIAKYLFDNKNIGLLSAILVSVVCGQLFYRSLYGAIDHHIAEVFFSCLFCLCYILLVKKQNYRFIIPCIISYFFLINVMTTCVFFGLIVCVSAFVLYFVKKGNGFIYQANVLIFGVISVLLLLTINTFELNVYDYSLGLVLVHCLIVFGNIVLLVCNKWHISKVIVAGLSGICVILIVLTPELYNMFSQFIPSTVAIAEMYSYSLDMAFLTFGFMLIVALIGVARAFKFIEKAEIIFLFSWLTVMLFTTLAHLRWEYYLAVVVCIFAGFGLWSLFKTRRLLAIALLILIIITSCFIGVYIAETPTNDETERWQNVGDWLQKNTPPLDYYDNAPVGAYCILSSWEYGHYIEVWGHRIPYSNPFQSNSDSEYMLLYGNAIDAKYVIITEELLTNKFNAVKNFANVEIAVNDTFMYKLYHETVNNYSLVYEYSGIKVFEKS